MSAPSRGGIWVLLSLLSLTFSVEIIHEKGRCLWIGQCTDDICQRSESKKFYNIFNNSLALNVTPESDEELYQLLEQNCPMYIDVNMSVAKVCCTAPQVRSLRDNIAQAQSLISRCPACLKNFVQHYCVIACDPDASSHMNGTIIDSQIPNSTVQIVQDAMVYLTDEYATDLYNSCANVQFAGGGAKVMNILCGTPNCNASQFLDFQGDPKLNGDESPFLIKYTINDTYADDGIIPLNDTGIHKFYKCSDSVPGEGPCSCSDCPSVCPLPPSFSVNHFPFKIYAFSVGGVGLFLSTVIFIAALTSTVYFWVIRKKNGYQPIAEQDSPPPRSTYGATDTTQGNRDKEASTTSSLNSDVDEDVEERVGDAQQSAMGCCCLIGHIVERTIKQVFYHWGKFVAKFWYIVLLVAIVITGVMSFGLFYFTVTTDPVKLWSAPTSRARLEMNYYDENFSPFYRTEQIVVKAKPFVQGFNVTPFGTVGLVWNFGPVFNKSVLTEVLQLQNHLAEMEVECNDCGNVTNVHLSDICFSPLSPQNKNCTIESVLNYFQNSQENLNKNWSFSTTDYSYHIHYCTRFPFSQKEIQSKLDLPCVGAYGGDIDPKVALGGYRESSDGTGYDYDTATVLFVTFIVNNHLHDDDNKMAMAWEKAMIDYLHDYKKHHAKLIDIEFSTERSIVDEINRESETDVVTIIISYLLMFLYITIFLGHVRSIKTIVVDSKIIVGFVGVLLVLFAVTSSLGVYSYFKMEASLIILEVVPFLVLAVGVDNLFILVHSYERQVKELSKKYGCKWEEIPTSEIIGRAVGDVAPSLLLTGLSETSAFLLGAVSIMPAVRTFSLYAGTAVFFNLLLQLSVFVAIMALDAMRQLRNRVDIVPCISLNGYFDPHVGLDYLSIAMRYFANVILYPLVKPFILLFFGLTLTSSVILMSRIEIGLDQNLALPKDSYLIPYFDELLGNIHTGAPVYFVVRDGANYTSPDIQNSICSSAGCSDDSLGSQITIYSRAPEESGIAESPLNWLDSYFAWLSYDGGCCGYYNNTDPTNNLTLCDKPQIGTDCVPCIMTTRPNATEFELFIQYFLAANPNITCASGGHAAFGDAVILDDDNETVLTSYVMTYHNSLKTSKDFINALKRARELSENVTSSMKGELEIFPYAVFYVYYEQYLTIVQDMLLNIGLALVAVFVVSFLLMGLNLWAAAVILCIVASIILHMLGSMAVLGINANAVSLVNLVMTVGIAVEFCAHIVRCFVSCHQPTRAMRAHAALNRMGASVFSGITVTKFLGVFVLLFAKSQLFEIYYFRMYMCMLVWGALHGLVFLPVILSYIGPPYCVNTLKSPYNDECFSKLPTLPSADKQPTQPPVTSYGNIDHTPSAPPINNSNYDGYGPPTRSSAMHTTPPHVMPSLYSELPVQQQNYPAPTTYPHNGSKIAY